VSAEREHGSRRRFLAGIGAGAVAGTPVPGPHPPPPPTADAPLVDYVTLPAHRTPTTLLAAFATAAVEIGATVVAREALPDVVAQHGLATGVVSAEPDAADLAVVLRSAGVTIGPYDRGAAAVADVGITSCVAAVAATGSVVVDSWVAGSRAVSLLPRVHLCAVPADKVVATPGDVLRSGRPLPSNLVFISGPSRTGDIEQILTTGVHGPTHLIIVIV
jgi:L-lactate utilization protein LutC